MPEALSTCFAKVAVKLIEKGLTTADKIGDERQRAKVLNLLYEVKKEET